MAEKKELKKGYESLKADYEYWAEREPGRKKEWKEKFDWAVERAQQYADKLGVTREEVLAAWEQDRDRIRELEEQNNTLTDMLDHICDENKVRVRRQISRGRSQRAKGRPRSSEATQRKATKYGAKRRTAEQPVALPEIDGLLPKPPDGKFIPYNEWVHRYDEQLRQEFPDRSNADLAVEQGVNYFNVSRQASRLGVSKSEAFMHQSWKKGGDNGWRVKGERRKEFMAQADEYMRAHFATTKNADLARLFGTDEKTVRRWARRLGLQKSDEFMQAARERGIASIRKGYYTPEHEAWRRQRISEIYPGGDTAALDALARELGLSRSRLNDLAQKYGIYRTKEATRAAQCEGYIRSGVKKYSDETIAAMRAYYPDHSTEECAERFGIRLSTLKHMASIMGLRKSKAYISALRSEITKRVRYGKKD